MTKKELNEQVITLCTQHEASEELTAALNELTKPKVGGGSADVNDYTVFDTDGNVTHVYCTYHKQWEPVADEAGEMLFKTNDKVKNGFDRECTEATASWRAESKVFKATKDGAIQDLLDGNISNDEAKDIIAQAEEARSVHTPREDGLGTDEKPEA